ncbi:MAG: peptidylprolyl isomerase [Bacteroidota bacterium]
MTFKNTCVACFLTASFLTASLAGAQTKPKKKTATPEKPAAAAATGAAKTGKSADNGAVILTLGAVKVPSYEFAYVYKKNNEKAEDAYTDKSVREYLDLYTNFKLKVIDAVKNGLDTTTAFKKELETYRKQLAQPYMTEKSVTEKLIKEAYERMKEEVNASHILISCAPDADPKDSLAAYNKIMAIRKNVLDGSRKFEDAAKAQSEDPSAKQNGGSLGYFTALQMVYPFEDAAYKLPKGGVSMPVRTRFGYHIIRLNDRRPSQGQVKIAHIMVKANPEMPKEDSLAAAKKAQEIYSRLQKGEAWSALCKDFSDDAGSKEKDGELPMFGTGMMIPVIEEAAFKLSKPGDFSAPVLSPYGWHIIKLLEKKPLDPYTELETTLKQKVNKDSRSELNSAALLARLRKENNLKEIPSVQKSAFAKGDTSLISGHWTYDEKDKANTRTMFTIGSKAYTVGDFYAFVKRTQHARNSTSPTYLMETAYKAYVDDELKKYEEEHLEEKYEDYRMLVKEYHEGILLFQLMDTKVWTKAMEDTTGLKEFYSKNKDKYRWSQRVNATIFNVANQKTLDDVKGMLKNKPFAVNEPKFADVKFDKNAIEPTKDTRSKILGVANQMRANKSLFIEVVGHVDPKEKTAISKKRAQAIVDSLVRRGVELKRITLKDYAKNKPAASGKAEDNQRVSFNVLDTTNKALEKVMNAKEALTVQVTEGMFQKGENTTLDALPWKVGDFRIENKENKDRILYVEIKAVEEPRAKTLDEARGLVISDYQNYLEKAWIEQLRKTYPVTVNEPEVKKLVKK